MPGNDAVPQKVPQTSCVKSVLWRLVYGSQIIAWPHLPSRTVAMAGMVGGTHDCTSEFEVIRVLQGVPQGFG